MPSNKPSNRRYYWDDVKDDDFLDEERDIEENDIGEYNLRQMEKFSSNINYRRQIPSISDFLKPAERRILWALYILNGFPGKKALKCSEIVGRTMNYHPHGDISTYTVLVGMTQNWKRNVPLVAGDSNFGDPVKAEAAHMRYTEATMSKYAKECFFDDFDEDCVIMVKSTDMSKEEPREFPSKFPNILVNGGMGIGIGYNFRIPSYNIEDIVRVTKRLIYHPEDTNIYMYPDLPTGCDIIDDHGELNKICETGTGKLRMRAHIEIEEKPTQWILWVRSIPWMVSLSKVAETITELTKKGKMSVLDLKDDSESYYDKKTGEIGADIKFGVVISKSLDPKAMISTLYKNTELEKTVSVQFNVTDNEPSIKMLNMRELILTWIDVRREYKRRLYNKRINKINIRIALLDTLIMLCTGNNATKTVSLIRRNKASDIPRALMDEYGMNSFQANKIAGMTFGSISEDARQRYIDEKNKLTKEKAEIMDIIKSEKKIDKIIADEIDELMKYVRPRKSQIISVANEEKVSNTDHIMVFTNKKYIKKLPATQIGRNRGYGIFEQEDFPVIRERFNNMETIMMFDNLGRYSIMPVYDIPNTDYKDYGNQTFKVTRLNGKIIAAYPFVTADNKKEIKEMTSRGIDLVTLSKKGVIKRTPIDEYLTERYIRNAKGAKMKEDDELVFARIILHSSNLLIYTRKGSFVYVNMDTITPTSKDTIGIQIIKLEEGDSCVGLCTVPNNATHLLVVTEKGNVKKCLMEYLGETRKRRDSSYLASLDTNDGIFLCEPITPKNKKIIVCSRKEFNEYPIEDIPEMTRKAKCKKIIPVALGDNLINIFIE